MKKNLALLVAVAIAVAAGPFIGESVLAHTRITTDINWGEHIRPIFRKKCMPCHHPGSVAPDYVDLTYYGTETDPGARAWAVAIEEMVLTDKMPPWDADPRFGHFENAKKLTEEEIDYIVAWVQGGAPQGPLRDLPVPEEFVEETWRFGQPDLVFEPEEEHLLENGETYARVSYTFPIDIEEDEWITGFEFLPDEPKYVHSMRAYVHDPEGAEPLTIEVEVQTEYDPFADEDELEQTRMRTLPEGPHFIGKWTPGAQPRLFPNAAARKLRAGSTVELQIEYRRPPFADPSQEVRDASKLGLFLAGENEEIDLLVESQEVTSEPFVVKAGAPDYEVTTVTEFEENVHVIGINPELGLLGKSLEVRATYPDGLSRTLLWIPAYKFWTHSTYNFAEPVAAPAGTKLAFVARYDNTENNWDNPNSPPKDVQSGPGPNEAKLAAVVDYMLDDHLQLPEVFVPPSDEEQARRGGMNALAGALPFGEDEAPADPDTADPKTVAKAPQVGKGVGDSLTVDVYWCPMRGNPCRIHDFHEPGACPDCGMDLITKEEWIESKTRGKTTVAKRTTDWQLSREGAQPIYWCPNREQPDHQLIDYPAPGPCPICDEMLAHKNQFEFVRTYVCITDTCPSFKKTYYTEGLCPDCGLPVQSMGHMDHTPVHGGQFFMASNQFHHLEGTLPEPGRFRLYFYDDYKRPLDARNFTGKVVFEDFDIDTGEFSEETYPMEVGQAGDPYLIADIPEEFPAEFYALVVLAGEENRFDFYFEEVTIEPEEPQTLTIGRLHSHEREPVEVPEKAVDVVREIFKRDSQLRANMDGRNWYGLHNPAFDAKDLMAALEFKLEGLGPRERGKFREALTAIRRGADNLDRAGDAADPPRVQRAYATFSEGIELLKEIWPEAVPPQQ